jgi:hypothetical protein
VLCLVCKLISGFSGKVMLIYEYMSDIEFQRELFTGTQKNALVLPPSECLNIFPNPDRDIKALPQSRYAMQEMKRMSKAFHEIFDAIKD